MAAGLQRNIRFDRTHRVAVVQAWKWRRRMLWVFIRGTAVSLGGMGSVSCNIDFALVPGAIMSLRCRYLLLLSVLGLVVGCAMLPFEGGPAAPAPMYRVGDRWVYQASDGFRVPATWVETH